MLFYFYLHTRFNTFEIAQSSARHSCAMQEYTLIKLHGQLQRLNRVLAGQLREGQYPGLSMLVQVGQFSVLGLVGTLNITYADIVLTGVLALR